jgi:membrane protease YdiL (CAAX protease family)
MTSPPGLGIAPKPWGLPAVLLALALPVLLWGSALAIAISTGAQEDLTQSEVITSLVFTIFLDAGLVGLAAGFSLWRYHLGWGELGLRRFDRSFWWLPLVAAAAAHVGVLVYALVLIVLGAEAPRQEGLEELFQSRAVLPLAGVATLLAAPVAEEIFFRGFIFPGLLRPFGLVGAMAASGFLFGAFHVTGTDTVALVLPFGLIGMLFAWIYYRTGSLWPSIATHLLFNLVSFVLLAAPLSSDQSTPTPSDAPTATPTGVAMPTSTASPAPTLTGTPTQVSASAPLDSAVLELVDAPLLAPTDTPVPPPAQADAPVPPPPPAPADTPVPPPPPAPTDTPVPPPTATPPPASPPAPPAPTDTPPPPPTDMPTPADTLAAVTGGAG